MKILRNVCSKIPLYDVLKMFPVQLQLNLYAQWLQTKVQNIDIDRNVNHLDVKIIKELSYWKFFKWNDGNYDQNIE